MLSYIIAEVTLYSHYHYWLYINTKCIQSAWEPYKRVLLHPKSEYRHVYMVDELILSSKLNSIAIVAHTKLRKLTFSIQSSLYCIIRPLTFCAAMRTPKLAHVAMWPHAYAFHYANADLKCAHSRIIHMAA